MLFIGTRFSNLYTSEARLAAEQAAAEALRISAEAARLAAVEAALEARGKHWEFLLYKFEFCSRHTRADVKCVSINGDDTIFLYDDGDWAYTSGLPDGLLKSLKTRARSHPPPTYVALGTKDRYYIEFIFLDRFIMVKEVLKSSTRQRYLHSTRKRYLQR